MKQRPINRADAMATQRKPSESSRIGNVYIIIICLAMLGISSISIYAVIILLFGLLPGLIAVIIDQEPNRFISKIVLSFNFSGIAPYIIRIIAEGSDSGNKLAVNLIIDPRTWMGIYGAAAFGWLVYYIFPQIAIMYNNITTQVRVKQLDKELSALTEEWGEEIKSGK